MDSQDIMACAGVIAACVGVVKTFKLFEPKYLPLVAIAMAAIFVLSPAPVQNAITAILVLGLTASGQYQYSKNREGK
ncbi:hypothetical protein SD71_16305 [Cohnella kolymensis]|uniref:Holin n=1 Tax=Cohnella kolymensis TaxID=1590652 RepID=A0ABR5A2B3_9BACL|nr:hypothetical protein [Cohnella kolymensis]KIL35184.1 hypothetical protein SD71_16305 [Cohnella kolymensis]